MGLLGEKKGLLGEKSSLLTPQDRIVVKNGGTSADAFDENTGTFYLNSETRAKYEEDIANTEKLLSDKSMVSFLDTAPKELKDEIMNSISELKEFLSEADGEIDVSKYPLLKRSLERGTDISSALQSAHMSQNSADRGDHNKAQELMGVGQDKIDLWKNDSKGNK